MGASPQGWGFRYGRRVGFDDTIGAAGKGRSEKTRSPFDALKVSTGQELFVFPAFERCDFLFWVQGSGGDRVQWTKQGAAAGAALRFLQAPAAARRKNRLSARGTNGDRVQWTMQGAAAGAVLQFLQGHSCPKKKLAKHKRAVASATGGVSNRRSEGSKKSPPQQERGFWLVQASAAFAGV